MQGPVLIRELKKYLDEHNYLSRDHLKNNLLPEINEWRMEAEGKEYDLDNAYRRLRQICEEKDSEYEPVKNDNGNLSGWRKKQKFQDVEMEFEKAKRLFARCAFSYSYEICRLIKGNIKKANDEHASAEDRQRAKQSVIYHVNKL